MTYIPNTRKKRITFPFSDQETDNPYWEGNLNKHNLQLIRVYDMAIEDALTLFDNLESFGDVLEEGIDQAPDYDAISANVDEASVNDTTKTILRLSELMREWTEMQRNELITSMIESQEEEAQ